MILLLEPRTSCLVRFIYFFVLSRLLRHIRIRSKFFVCVACNTTVKCIEGVTNELPNWWNRRHRSYQNSFGGSYTPNSWLFEFWPVRHLDFCESSVATSASFKTKRLKICINCLTGAKIFFNKKWGYHVLVQNYSGLLVTTNHSAMLLASELQNAWLNYRCFFANICMSQQSFLV